MLNGTLAQGDPEVLGLPHGTLAQKPRVFAEDDNPVSFFAVGESGNAGLYIYRNDFAEASCDAEDERLTTWLGPVAITVEPKRY